MATLVESTLSLSPDVLAAAQDFATRRHCTLDSLTEDALRTLLGMQSELDPRFEADREEARQLGMTTDEYAVHVVKEVRRAGRAAS